MRSIIAVLIVSLNFFTVFSCISQDFVIINFSIDNVQYSKRIPSSITELMLESGISKSFTKIEGIENLGTLRKLILSATLPDVSTLNFSGFSSLDTLVIGGCKTKDFSFLKNLPNLRILFLDGVITEAKEIDLSNNRKLFMIGINNLIFGSKSEIDNVGNHEKESEIFVLNLKNIPESLKFIDMRRNRYIEIDNNFLYVTSSVSKVILPAEIYERFSEYFNQHENYIFKSGKDVLPIELQRDTLERRPQYTIP